MSIEGLQKPKTPAAEATTLDAALEQDESHQKEEAVPSAESAPTQDPQKEAYAFSKEYSREYRSRLAKELWAIRQKHRVEVPEHNAGQAKLRELIDEKLEGERELVIRAEKEYSTKEAAQEAAKAELQEREREVAELESQFEKEKSSLLNTVKGWIGMATSDRKTELELGVSRAQAESAARGYDSKENETQRAQEWLRTTQSGAELMVADLWRKSGEAQDIVLDEIETDVINKKINDFYTKQLEVKSDWHTTQAERSVSRQAQEHNVVFLHGLPQGEFMANTAGNNPTLNTSELSGRAKADLVVGLEPTISVSTFSLSEGADSGLMYQSGLIIGEGTVMSAFEEDAATYAESFDVKFPKYDENAVSSVQPNPAEAIAGAVAQEGRRTLPWNEIVVRRPKVAGAFVYKGYGGREGLVKQLELAQHLGVPLVQVEQGKPMIDLLTGEVFDNKNIAEHTGSVSVDERLQYAEQGLHEAYSTPQAESGAAPTKALVGARVERIKAEGGVVPVEQEVQRKQTQEQAREALQALTFRSTAENILYWNKEAQAVLAESGDALADYLLADDASFAPLVPLLKGKSGEEVRSMLRGMMDRADTILARHMGEEQESEALAA